MSRRPLSEAQVRFMNEHAPAYFAWLRAVGHSVGIKIQPWQRRVVEAMIRKGFLTEEGHVTEAGKKAWDQSLSSRRPRPPTMEEAQKTA